jgi:hypothetical protein
MIHLLDLLGITSTNKVYNFWSGLGSDLGELTIASTLYRHVNCHVRGCWRWGHSVNGTITCHKHRKEHHAV